MNNYFLVHGSFGNPFVNWFEWLFKQIQSQGKRVYCPQFPTGVGFQNYENWSKLLKYYLDLGLINEDTIFVGHSISPIFITKFIIENKIKVAKLIFVEGFNNASVNEEYDIVNASMFMENVEEIHKYCDNIIAIYSNNDPYLKIPKQIEEFANTIADKTEFIYNAGHINSESGYDTFEEILKYL